MVQRTNLLDHLSNYFQNSSELGLQSTILLDTSAIIDLDTAYRHDQRYGYRRAVQFLQDLKDTAKEQAVLLVPLEIKPEVERHYTNNHINGNPEVSLNTANAICRLPSSIDTLELFEGEMTRSIDLARYFIRLMAPHKLRLKKVLQDPVSPEDWSVIDMAVRIGLSSWYAIGQEHPNSRGLPCRTAVLSSDDHIIQILSGYVVEAEGIALASYVFPVDLRKYSLGGKE